MTRQRRIYIKNWITDAHIGIHAHEYDVQQKVRLNLTFFQNDATAFAAKKITDCVDYQAHKDTIQRVIDAQHEPLIETLADRIAQACLRDPHVTRIIVEVEKLAILPDTESCGVVIERTAMDY